MKPETEALLREIQQERGNSEWPTCSECGHCGPTYGGYCDRCGA